MSEFIHEPQVAQLQPVNETPPTPTVEQAAAPEVPGWHAEAGRKGAQRIHQLIQEGKLYEKEHGLKRGRQRLRQLIELGKVYEQEHGLTATRRARRARQNSEQQLQTLLQALLRVVKPSVRGRLTRMLQELSEAA